MSHKNIVNMTVAGWWYYIVVHKWVGIYVYSATGGESGVKPARINSSPLVRNLFHEATIA